MNREEGFSLIEIMAALTIFGIVVGLVAVNVTGSLTQAKVKSAKIAMETIAGAIEEFRRDCNRYPSTDEGLKALVDKPADCRNYKPGGYLSKTEVPRDPWDHEFLYNSPPLEAKNFKYEIVSYGADGAPGGQNEDEDINSNTMKLN